MIFSPRQLVVAAASILMLSAPVFAAPVQNTPNAAASQDKAVVAKVNGAVITQQELDNAANKLMPAMAYHSSVPPEREKQIRKKALEELINIELIYNQAKKDKSITVNPKDIDSEVSNLKKKLSKGDTLEKALNRSNMTMAELREYFKKVAMVKRMSEKMQAQFNKDADVLVNEDYMKAYYQDNLSKFKEPEKIRLRSILIKADPSGGQRAWDASLKKAEDIYKKAKAGEDFRELAKKYSEDPYASRGGDMGWSHKGSLYPEIDAAAENMKLGEVSEPVQTIYGYHVLKMEGKQPSVQKKFSEINKQTLKKELQAKEYKSLSDDWIKELRSKAKIEIIKGVD